MPTSPTLPLTVAGRERDVDCSSCMEQQEHCPQEWISLEEIVSRVDAGWFYFSVGHKIEKHEVAADLLIGVCKRECERLLRDRVSSKNRITLHRRMMLSYLEEDGVDEAGRHLVPNRFRIEAKHVWDATDLEIWTALLVEVRALCDAPEASASTLA